MINQIITCLNNIKEITDWKVIINHTKTTECFYILNNLETTRKTDTTEYEVTVYRKHENYMGQATIKIPHKMTDKELNKLISDAVYSANLVQNEPFEIVKGTEKLVFEGKELCENPLETIDKVAQIFINVSTPNNKFNSLEVFYNTTTTQIINSQGVDYKKTLNSLEVEAIPSFDGENEKVEIYKFYRYKEIDYDTIKQDAIDALNEVELRFNAEKPQEKIVIDVILRDNSIIQLVRELISTSSYASVYKKSALFKLNDFIQKDAKGDLLTITLAPLTEYDGFDSDGVLLKPTTIVDNGKLINYFGDNQYAYYLGIKPTGKLLFTKLEPGNKSIQEMKTKPYLEILSLSGLQVDIYNSYIGGEVRLAKYFDGNKTIPLTGFSFSGNLNEILKDIELSKEKYVSTSYEGPKYIKLKNLEIL